MLLHLRRVGALFRRSAPRPEGGWETLDPFAVSPARRAARKTLRDHEAPRRRASLRFGAPRQPAQAPALVGELKQWPESAISGHPTHFDRAGSLQGHFARIALRITCGPEPGHVMFITSGRRMASRATLNISPRLVPVGTQ